MTWLVVGVDTSPASKKALDVAVDLAQSLKASLALVYAGAPVPPGPMPPRLDAISRVNAEIDAHEVAKIAATWGAEAGKRVPVEVVSEQGDAAQVILAEAVRRQAKFVVVGSHGRTGLKRVFLGSVAQAVVKGSKAPVVVVPS